MVLDINRNLALFFFALSRGSKIRWFSQELILQAAIHVLMLYCFVIVVCVVYEQSRVWSLWSAVIKPQGCVTIDYSGQQKEMPQYCTLEISRKSPSGLSGVLPGMVTLQNLPSAVAAMVLDPKPGWRVLDMCAAPGGKTTAIAQLMEDTGEVIALDRTHAKVS